MDAGTPVCPEDQEEASHLRDVQSPLVIVHSPCNDGFGAAWVSRWAFVAPDIHHAVYGTKPPDVKGRDVVMIDFTYDRETTERMIGDSRSLVVIDHHATAQKELAGLPGCYFDMERCGSRLAFDLYRQWGLVRREKVPILLDYVQDRDLEQWRLPFTREVNAALTSHPMEFGEWDQFDDALTRQFESVVSQGEGIMNFQDVLVTSIVERATEVVIDDYQVLSANASVLWGEVAERLSHDRPFGVAWYRRGDGKFVYSLRSEPDGVNVGQLAKMHGGGGHDHMAGLCADVPLV